MMAPESPRIRSLLRQAKRTESAGKRTAAEQLYRQIVAEDAESVEGWLGLARVVNSPAEKEAAYQEVLQLDPEYSEDRDEPDLLADPEIVEVDEDSAAIEVNRAAEQLEEFSESLMSLSSGEHGESIERLDPDPNPILQAEPVLSYGDDLIHEHEPAVESELLFCANHPGRQTHLRCNRCGKPICSSCAQPTPVGYRCPECIREHEDIFYTAKAIDYIIALVVALPLSFLAGYIASLIGFFAIFLAAVVGSFLGRIVFRATGRRRGRGLPVLVAVAIVLGGLLPLLAALLTGNILRAVFIGIYIVAASGAAYYQMR